MTCLRAAREANVTRNAGREAPPQFNCSLSRRFVCCWHSANRSQNRRRAEQLRLYPNPEERFFCKKILHYNVSWEHENHRFIHCLPCNLNRLLTYGTRLRAGRLWIQGSIPSRGGDSLFRTCRPSLGVRQIAHLQMLLRPNMCAAIRNFTSTPCV